MKGGRGLAIAAIGGLGLWIWSKQRVGARPATRPVVEPPPPPLAQAMTKEEIAKIVDKLTPEAVASDQPVEIDPGVYVHASSVIAAAEITGQPVEEWLKYLGPAPVGEIVYTQAASGVYESALPQQIALRETFVEKYGYNPPGGGLLSETFWDNQKGISWSSDPVHPVVEDGRVVEPMVAPPHLVRAIAEMEKAKRASMV